jgi:cytidyltransferase-like protein
MKISVVSGGFDPLHSGHLEYLQSAKDGSDKLIVLLNSDEWLSNKKGKPFLPVSERKLILESIKYVDEVILFDDDDKGSCINGLKKVISLNPNDEIIFCNGGDRNKSNIPEMELTEINFKFGVGSEEKKNSSSWILKEYIYNSEEKVWGKYYNLYEAKNVKVKELIVKPDQGMSFQRHTFRNEIWLVSEGKCIVHYQRNLEEKKKQMTLAKHDHFLVNVLDWHQITNPFDKECKIIEIQYGKKTIEDDIEREHFYKDNRY